jgi:demethylmenaquinone methyltransferase/2-methoxy-6-polyprenyl-1,4-benzoquinol methylase
MFDTIAPRYEAVNHLMTFGLDGMWRRGAIAALGLPGGSRVLDIASGTGDFARMLEARGDRVVAVDLSWGMLTAPGQHEATRVQADVSRLPLHGASVDGATCGFALRNFVDLEQAFAELARVVRRGGRIALLEVARPANPVVEIVNRLWFEHAVPVIGGLLSEGHAYRYLPRSVEYLPGPERIRSMLRAAGFAAVGRRTLWPGVVQVFTATRSGAPS